jgi:UDP-N-acetylglucosamine 1-carboxyvinyltransferase
VADTLVIEGGHSLSGKVKAGGSKNLPLPILASLPLVGSKASLANVPNILDVHLMCRTLSLAGASSRWVKGKSDLEFDLSSLKYINLVSPSLSELRASFLFLGSFAARFNRAVIINPGGDQIG